MGASKTPKSLKDIEFLVSNEVQESLHLDYKQSAAISKNKKKDISKDVSSFANADGGVIVYGVEENEHLPVKIDDGIDHSYTSREWLEQVIASNITPKIDGVRIHQIPLSRDKSIYVVEIEKSHRAPHQASDKKYYKRSNFISAPMEDYEINDVRNRIGVTQPLINVCVRIIDSSVILEVSNIGPWVARDISFQLSQPIIWEWSEPPIFSRGINALSPTEKLPFYWASASKLLAANYNGPISFEITARYIHPQVGQQSETFYIDVGAYKETLENNSELHELRKVVERSLGDLTKELNNMNRNLKRFRDLWTPTGLNLSVTTLRRLNNIAQGKDLLERINPYDKDSKFFQEVLGIDDSLARQLEFFFQNRNNETKLDEIEGLSPEVFGRFKEYFEYD